jgi:hypothetical protein
MRTRVVAVAVGAILGMSAMGAVAEDMVLYATPGYIEALRTREMMHDIDANHDGKVSREEWAAFQGRVFDALDKDGFLEPQEFFGKTSYNVIPFTTLAFQHGLMTQQMFGKIDANGDGKVSRQEFIDYQLKLFDMMDVHKSKELSAGDFIVGK